jgi:tungstate transport system substrate-binding protein
MMPIRLLRALVVLLAPMVLSAPVAAQERFIVLASTTSTANSGLLDYLVPMFRDETGIDVRVVAVGTGQALELGRRGDADALLVHAPAAEKRFVAEGYGIDRRQVMYNDFVIVGPEDDPAQVAAADSAVQAFRRIADAEAAFASRADDSGTHKKEMSIWDRAGIDPGGRWYRELGSGMGATLNTAAAMNAYALADRGTWISFDNRQDLTVLHEGDEILFNPYGSILVNPERHDHIKIDMARAWHDWLVSEQGQQAIGDFRLRGRQLFVPSAD